MKKYLLALLALLFMSANLSALEVVTQKMVKAPNVPVHTQVAVGGPKVIKVEMTVDEWMHDLGDGTKVRVIGFNKQIPGPMIIAHVGDYVELTLTNPATNAMIHNVDFHAATGFMGGGSLTEIAPGEKVVLKWKAIKAGVFTYHCAPGGAMIPYHVVSGMTGSVMILPREGLTDDVGKAITYDKVWYIGENDFYVKNGIIDMGMMKGLLPSHVVFNGAIGSLTGKNALKSTVGEKVLVVHGQANNISSPHMIGSHADYFWSYGSFANKPLKDLETWFIPAGSTVAALVEFRAPGLHAYVNHNLIKAILLGAAAHIVVDGEADPDLMEQVYKGKI